MSENFHSMLGSWSLGQSLCLYLFCFSKDMIMSLYTNICFYSFFGGSLYFVSVPCLPSRVLRLGSQDLAVILWIDNTECSPETVLQTPGRQVSSVSVLFSYFVCISSLTFCKEYRKSDSLFSIASFIKKTVNVIFFQ